MSSASSAPFAPKLITSQRVVRQSKVISWAHSIEQYVWSITGLSLAMFSTGNRLISRAAWYVDFLVVGIKHFEPDVE